MLLIIVLGLIAKLALVSGDCEVGNMKLNSFVWSKMCWSIDMLPVTIAVKISSCLNMYLFPLLNSQNALSHSLHLATELFMNY